MISPNTYNNTLKETPKVYDYLVDTLKYSPEVISRFKIGLCLDSDSPYSNRLLYPIYDEYGDLVTYQGRALFDWKSLDLPKYWHGKFDDKSKATCLYGFYEQKEHIVKANRVVLTEGPPDALAFIEAGIPAVAVLGTAFSIKTYYMLRKYTDTLITAFDNDDAGRSATAKVNALLDSRFVNVYNLTISGYKDARELYVEEGITGLKSIPVTKVQSYEANNTTIS
jgi:DNA primase